MVGFMSESRQTGNISAFYFVFSQYSPIVSFLSCVEKKSPSFQYLSIGIISAYGNYIENNTSHFFSALSARKEFKL